MKTGRLGGKSRRRGKGKWIRLRHPDRQREGRGIAVSWEVAWGPGQTQWMCWGSGQRAAFVQPTFNRRAASLTPGYSRLWIKLRPACTSTPFRCCKCLTWLWRSTPIFSCFSSLANVDKLLYTFSWNFQFSSLCWAEEVSNGHIWKPPGWETAKKSVYLFANAHNDLLLAKLSKLKNHSKRCHCWAATACAHTCV